jgi:hypothetical protein
VPRTYNREEADEILRRALLQQAGDGVSHDDLVAAAREVGIPETAIEEAASQLGEHRLVKERVELIRRQKRHGFGKHLLSYLIANGGVFLVDYIDGGPWYFHYLLIVWGIFLLLLGIRQLAPDEAKLVKRAERELEKERKLERQRRRSGQPGHAVAPGAAKEFERAVQEGVNALLGAAARTIRDYTPGQQRYRAEDRQQHSPPREPVPGEETSAAERRQRRV